MIDEGRVKEAGAHAELVSLGGIYAGMFHTQSRRYQKKRQFLGILFLLMEYPVFPHYP